MTQRPWRWIFSILLMLGSIESIKASETSTFLDQIESRIQTGEIDAVSDQLATYIQTTKQQVGNYGPELARPYLLLGDAQLADRQPANALGSYELAWQILRMNQGLSSQSQIDALYRMSDALVELNDFESANRMQETACEIALQKYGFDDVRVLPSLIKLIEWYESNRRYSATKFLYLKVIPLANQVVPQNDPRQLDMARSVAKAMRNIRYPPMSGETIFRPFSVNVPGYEELPPGKRRPSSYSLGADALTRVVDYMANKTDFTDQEKILARLNLADWHQLYGRESQAIRLYRDIWLDLEPYSELRSRIFDDPQLLYIRLPQSRTENSSHSGGIVELLLTVSYRGQVIGRISQTVEPANRRIEHRTRMAAREARFRPAFENGRPITTKGYILEHTYNTNTSSG